MLLEIFAYLLLLLFFFFWPLFAYLLRGETTFGNCFRIKFNWGLQQHFGAVHYVCECVRECVCACVCVTYNACYPALRLLRACLTYYTYYISCCSRSASQNGSSFLQRLLLCLLLWLAALQTSQAAAIWTCVIIVRVGNWQLLLRSLLPLAGSAANLTSSCENWRCCTAASLTLLGHAWIAIIHFNFSVLICSLSMHLVNNTVIF